MSELNAENYTRALSSIDRLISKLKP